MNAQKAGFRCSIALEDDQKDCGPFWRDMVLLVVPPVGMVLEFHEPLAHGRDPLSITVCEVWYNTTAGEFTVWCQESFSQEQEQECREYTTKEIQFLTWCGFEPDSARAKRERGAHA